jgi:hypothetical protein
MNKAPIRAVTPHVASKLDAAEDRYMFGGGLPTFVHAGVRAAHAASSLMACLMTS